MHPLISCFALFQGVPSAVAARGGVLLAWDWGVLSGPKNADPAKFPRRVIKRTVTGGVLPLSGIRREGRVSPSSPEVGDGDRQPEIVAISMLCNDKRRSLRRLGNFLAEVPDKVFDGVIDVQRRHGPEASKVAAPAATLNLRL